LSGQNAGAGRPTAFILSLAVVAAGGTLLLALAPELFAPYFGGVPPVLAFALIVLAGWPALHYLDRRGGFALDRAAGRRRGLRAAATLALPFMVAVTLADVAIGFAAAINVRLPAALVFYPVMGCAAIVSLHAVPLALALAAARWLLRAWPEPRRVALAAAVAASGEAAFQWHFTQGPPALGVFVAAELYAFGVVELWLYRRYDFVSMLAFRMTYYAYWHVLWGALRLELLF